MEKALLKVTRFNNSDVIATSGDTDYCTAHTEHYIPRTKDEAKGVWYGDAYRSNNEGVWGEHISNFKAGFNVFPSDSIPDATYGYIKSADTWEYCDKKSK